MLAFAFLLVSAPQQLAIDYLAREVPQWSSENHCYSCHNNGDAARALFLAIQRGMSVPKEAVADTLAWLSTPARWDDNRGNPGFSDKRLARVQFASALTEAYRTGVVQDRRALVEAAESLLPEQAADGSWKIDTGGAPGAPATYGTALATSVSRRTLETAGRERFADPIARATKWLKAMEPANVPDLAALLLAEPAERSRVPQLLAAQTSDGGWGPQARMPAEPFDTALALLALQAAGGPPEAIARGRAWLIARQETSGGWPETTRPPGQQSYAEHISTTGWAAYALLATDAKRE